MHAVKSVASNSKFYCLPLDKEDTINTCTPLLAESINKWVERINGCEGRIESIINTNFWNFLFHWSGKFYRKNVREFQKTLAVAIMNNFCLISFHFFMVSTIWNLSCIKDGLLMPFKRFIVFHTVFMKKELFAHLICFWVRIILLLVEGIACFRHMQVFIHKWLLFL